VRNVRFGIGIFTAEPLPKVIEEVKLAEQLGYDSVWLLDSQLVGREVYGTMAACARATSRIKIASGVINTFTRHPTVAACAFATLNELSPGRFMLGIGRGDSAVRSFGLEPTKFGQFRTEVAMIRSLLAGESLQLNGREIKIKFIDPKHPPKVPIYVATGGPQSLRVAAQIGDGVIVHNGPNEEMIRRSLEIVRSGAAEVGRKLSDMPIVWWSHTSIGPDWQAVKEHARPKIASKFRQRKTVDLSELGADLDEETRRKAKEAYNFLEHATAGASHGYVADLIPEPIWRELSLLGTGAEARERVERIVDRFPEITEVVINPPVPGYGLTYESIMSEFAEAVMA
jgi:5,10-methylenetetrahydromethanopterin reductase